MSLSTLSICRYHRNPNYGFEPMRSSLVPSGLHSTLLPPPFLHLLELLVIVLGSQFYCWTESHQGFLAPKVNYYSILVFTL